MIKRTKWIALAAILSLAAALAGCGASSSSTAPSSSAPSSQAASSEAAPSAPASSAVSTPEQQADDSALDDAVDALLAVNPISNRFEITAMNIEYDFGLSAEDVVRYKGVKSNDNGDAGLVLVIEPAEGRAQAVQDALETYREDQAVFYGNYAEFAAAQNNVEHALISGSDSRVVMVVASNEAEASASALSDAVSRALE